MKNDTQKIIEDTQKLCREGWEIRNRAIRAVEDSKTISDQIWENIRSVRKKLKKSKQELARD